MRKATKLLMLLVVLALLAAACGGDDDEATPDTLPETTEAPAETTTTAAPAETTTTAAPAETTAAPAGGVSCAEPITVGVITDQSGAVTFTDDESQEVGQRFYRVVRQDD